MSNEQLFSKLCNMSLFETQGNFRYQPVQVYKKPPWRLKWIPFNIQQEKYTLDPRLNHFVKCFVGVKMKELRKMGF